MDPGVVHPGLGSFQDVQAGEPEPSLMDSEYGMPITEDAENMHTMKQMKMNFNMS